MGQKLGKADYIEAALPFTNPVVGLWETFNSVADGFGISLLEFKDIMRELGTELDVTNERMDSLSEELFRALDTDKNGLIDALETLATLSVASGMWTPDTVKFIFNCYDFNEVKAITIDEMTLALRSAATGLCKLTNQTSPTDIELESISAQAFRQAGKNGDDRISLSDFLHFCLTHPETRSWMEHFDDNDRIRSLGTRNNANQTPDNLEELSKAVVTAPEGGERPFNGMLLEAVPSQPPREDTRLPQDCLELRWVHGAKGSLRKGVAYSSTGDIVYVAGAISVVLNPQAMTQRYYSARGGAVQCMAISENGALVATGYGGADSSLVVWEPDSLKTLVILKGYQAGTICLLAFSKDTSLLLSVSKDKDYLVGLYRWRSKELLYTSVATHLPVLACSFASTEDTFACAGVDHIFFWGREGQEIYSKKKGIFGQQAKRQTITCMGSLEDYLLTGTVSGHLYLWYARNCVKVIKAHNNAITCLCTFTSGVITGGKDHKIRLYTKALEPRTVFDVSSFGVLPVVQSVQIAADRTKILVGLLSSEVLELSAMDGSNIHPWPLVTGHFRGGVSGMDVHPERPEICSVGPDRTLRIWDLRTKRLLRMMTLEGPPAYAVRYSANGQHIVLGIGSLEHQHRNNGAFMVLREKDFQPVHEARDASESITDIKFSPNGAVMGMTSGDGGVYFYRASDYGSLSRSSNVKKGQGLLRLDFSEDSEWAQCLTSAKGVSFVRVADGSVLQSAASVKDITWGTLTVPFNYRTQGIWPKQDDGRMFKVTCRLSTSPTVVAGDSSGGLSVVHYPATKMGSPHLYYPAHGATINHIVSTKEEDYLLSCSEDACILQWERIKLSPSVSSSQAAEASGFLVQEEVEAGAKELLPGSAFVRVVGLETVHQTLDSGALNSTANVIPPSEQGNPLRMWLKSVVAPSSSTVTEPNLTPPTDRLTLRWVSGYSAEKLRRNLEYDVAGRLVYTAGAVVVSLDQSSRSQRFNLAHKDEILSFAMHPMKDLVATGEAGTCPSIVIWSTMKGEVRQILRGEHEGGVSLLRFSEGTGELLLSVGLDPLNTLILYHWEDGHVLHRSTLSPNKVLGACFHPRLPLIMTCGIQHVSFWETSPFCKHTPASITGVKNDNPKIFIDCLYLENGKQCQPIASTSDGYICQFDGSSLSSSIKAHTSAISLLAPFRDGFATGGRDGMLKLWNRSLQCLHEIETLKINLKTTAIGSSGGQIWQIETEHLLKGEVRSSQCSVVMHTHTSDELWGLAVHPKLPDLYATVGDDEKLQIWSLSTKTAIRSLDLENSARSVCYSPTGKLLAIGLGSESSKGRHSADGKILIVTDEKSLQVAHSFQDSKMAILEIKYSHTGTVLAAASADNNIYIYMADKNYQRCGTFSKHQAPVTHFDFSIDGQYLRSNDSSLDLLFADVTTGSHIPVPGVLKDIEWATSSCPLSWASQACWDSNYPNAIVTSVDSWPAFGSEMLASGGSDDKERGRNSTVSVVPKSGRLVAAADDLCRLRLFRFPAGFKGALCHTFFGHSEGISKVKWTADGSFLLSLCPKQRSVYVWERLTRDEDSAIESDGDQSGDEAVGKSQETEDGTGHKGKDAAETYCSVPMNVMAPSEPIAESTAPLSLSPSLLHVFGYSRLPTRSEVFYGQEGQLLFPAGSMGISLNLRLNAQRMFKMHKAAICCMVPSFDGKLVATADSALPCSIWVWDAITGVVLAQISNLDSDGVSILRFSRDRRRLFSVARDTLSTVTVYFSASGNWNDAVPEARGKTSPQRVLALYSLEYYVESGEAVCCGQKQVSFLSVSGKHVLCHFGHFGRRFKKLTAYCATSLREGEGEVVLTGMSTGDIYVWGEKSVLKSVAAHTRALMAMHATEHGLVTGGRDGMLKIWNRHLTLLREFDLKPTANVSSGFSMAITSVCWDPQGKKVAVATRESEVFEFVRESGTLTKIAQGQMQGELWALSCHPSDPDCFCSIGDDGVLKVWSIRERRVTACYFVGTPARAVCWSPDGKKIAIGMGGPDKGESGTSKQRRDGALLALEYPGMSVCFEDRKTLSRITDLKFSPEGHLLAASSKDGSLYVHDMAADGKLLWKSQSVGEEVKNFDFSLCGKFIQCLTRSNELIYYYSVTDGSMVKQETCKDAVWHRSCLPAGWTVQGLWPSNVSQERSGAISSIDFSYPNPLNGRVELIAACNEAGQVEVTRNPCIDRKHGDRRSEERHRGGATAIKFTADNRFLLSAGKKDGCIMLWELRSNEPTVLEPVMAVL